MHFFPLATLALPIQKRRQRLQVFLGLGTRFVAVPFLIEMVVAMLSTKIGLWSSAAEAVAEVRRRIAARVAPYPENPSPPGHSHGRGRAPASSLTDSAPHRP
jgi:hypothetical protein